MLEVERLNTFRGPAHVLRDVVNGEGAYPRRYMPRLARELRNGAGASSARA